jgi:hypothetical protein
LFHYILLQLHVLVLIWPSSGGIYHFGVAAVRNNKTSNYRKCCEERYFQQSWLYTKQDAHNTNITVIIIMVLEPSVLRWLLSQFLNILYCLDWVSDRRKAATYPQSNRNTSTKLN